MLLADKKIGILICYEGILPFAAGSYKQNGAELLVNITNDAWFGATSAPYQHLSMSIFRAIETRMYLVRAANTGISAIVNPQGKIITQTNIFQKAALKGNVKFLNIPTFYAIYGDIVVFGCYAIIIICFLWSWKRRIQ
jgi:apolipoprotein N-acyltransferase